MTSNPSMLSSSTAAAAALSSSSSYSSSTALKNRSQASELNDFLLKLDSYNPTIPENLTQYYLERSGLEIKDPRIAKLISLAADKLLSEILYEAKQIAALRAQNSSTKAVVGGSGSGGGGGGGSSSSGGKKRKAENDVLEMEDVQISLAQMRIFLRRRKLSHLE